MSAHAQASECRRLARALATESGHWSGQHRSDLLHNAVQLGYTARAVSKFKPAVVQAVIDAAGVILDLALMERAAAEYRMEVSRG